MIEVLKWRKRGHGMISGPTYTPNGQDKLTRNAFLLAHTEPRPR